MAGDSKAANAVARFEVMSVDLPFRLTFKHAAAARSMSNSIFLKCTTQSGAVGYGECLPREYVTNESRDGAHSFLCDEVLPRLIDKPFADYDDVRAFLNKCDGKAPEEWGYGHLPQTAAWCAVDLAMLDAFGHQFGQPALESSGVGMNPDYRFSAVISAGTGLSLFKTLLKLRLFGIRQVKVKIGDGTDLGTIRKIGWILGRRADIRIDLNMLWSHDEALRLIGDYVDAGVQSFEQPLPAEQLQEMADLVEETGAIIMADESLNDAKSLDTLITLKACNAVNVRISKCGGLMAALSRCSRALDAGLLLQVGCQVGESSLLSSAQLALMTRVSEIRYLEGSFGTLLLEEDPARPALRFGHGGSPPERPRGNGLGVTVDEGYLGRFTARHDILTEQRR